jgi:hypothetical protein
MKYLKFLTPALLAGMLACGDGMSPLGPAGPALLPPGANDSLAQQSIWLSASGNQMAVNSRMVYTTAGFVVIPDTVCWTGEFNGWSTNCNIRSGYDASIGGHVFPLGSATIAALESTQTFDRCTRVTFFNRTNTSQYLPVEEFIINRGGLNNLTTQQRSQLRADPQGPPVDPNRGNGMLPALAVVRDAQGTRARTCT